jgi:hypothetical protein
MNVVELEQYRKKEVTRDRELQDALFFGMENSVHAREDPTDPNSPRSIGQFLAHCANEAPLEYMRLLNKLLASEEWHRPGSVHVQSPIPAWALLCL